MRIVWERDDFPPEKVYVTKVGKPRRGEQLGESVYLVKDGAVTHKTCPNCSKAQGRYVWRPMPSYHFRVMRGGHILPQSWCEGCRRSK